MMCTTRNIIVFTALFLTLMNGISSAPQYLDRCFYPVPVKEGLIYLASDARQDSYEMQGSSPINIYPINYFWYNPDFFPDKSLVPPVREESEFRFVGPKQGTEDGNGLQRGRSDIDPVEDNEAFGYFYPKPKTAFDLPDFTPLSDTSELPQDVSVTTTTTEEITDKITTVLAPETSPGKV